MHSIRAKLCGDDMFWSLLKKMMGDGLLVLVDWIGLDEDEYTWEPIENVR